MPKVVEVDGNSMIEISRAEIENFYISGDQRTVNGGKKNEIHNATDCNAI